MKKFLLTGATLGVMFAFAGFGAAKADVITTNLDFTGSGGLSSVSLGTVTITQSSTEVDYVVTLTNGAIWQSGLTTFFADVTGNITNVSVSGTNAPSGVTFTQNGGAPGNADGLKGNNAWDVSTQCNGAGGSVNCGTTLTLTVTGSNLGVGSEVLSNQTVFAGLDVTCSSTNLNSSNTPCLANSPVSNTGVVGATAVAVPGPALGAGLPGLVAACMGLVAFARRRRRLRLA